MIVKVVAEEGVAVPKYMTEGAVGFDITINESVTLRADEIMYQTITKYPVIVGTGLRFEIPEGYELEIRTRSGLGFKDDVICHNGTIDSDYRGELKLKLWNLGNRHVYLTKGDRVAQGIIKKVEKVEFLEVEELSTTDRGTGGFGHTGK
jgi:dUTP pyrophosphatase